jgi:hypothetical protein
VPRLKYIPYQLVHGILFRKNYDGVLLQCLEKKEVDKVLKDMHDGPARGHFLGDIISLNILRVGYYWPFLFKDSHAYSRSYNIFQKSTRRERKVDVFLQLVAIEDPFEKLGLDIIGEINPHSSKQQAYIPTSTNYFTCYNETVPLTKVNNKVVINFLEQYIMTRFGVYNSLLFDNTTYISSLKIDDFSLDKEINLKYATNY